MIVATRPTADVCEPHFPPYGRRGAPTLSLFPMHEGLVDRKAPAERTWLDETSWIDVVRGFVPDSGPLFSALLREVSWHQNRAIRGGRMVDDPRLDSSLGARGAAEYPILHVARLVLDARYRVRLSSVHLILYRDGRDGMGFHRDDEMRYLERTVIAGLSLGAPRSFALRPRRGGATVEFMLGSGDLYVMGGRCQADWLHGVPKVPECGPKISAVWRWAWKQGRPEPPSRWGP